ncbi:uncharacterized protein LACBIDRAFT_331902 [Laccaria bicolor S238N-H82]|uniref:Predicted protein n=1 Tax=Laccaria bicolor (strain S238N-H82 / ATCC MYA-4686) TaxID=486041 RepID=B0DQZ4_LACBS|nr:uncharacterized protein LACBIDRAFT_331902 [Laccaria bicolor S238N-H82]EDR02908.1 predicted protein [Laccaria bicolor S238N-H82]|eukprot:XP_001886331.1 predicted protein [Laccaria bicolor S238N-H82]
MQRGNVPRRLTVTTWYRHCPVDLGHPSATSMWQAPSTPSAQFPGATSHTAHKRAPPAMKKRAAPTNNAQRPAPPSYSSAMSAHDNDHDNATTTHDNDDTRQRQRDDDTRQRQCDNDDT